MWSALYARSTRDDDGRQMSKFFYHGPTQQVQDWHLFLQPELLITLCQPGPYFRAGLQSSSFLHSDFVVLDIRKSVGLPVWDNNRENVLKATSEILLWRSQYTSTSASEAGP
ncbi:hypothetical protein M514_02455 [Trichuris suis]|uniref:Uncharacterized protein n=1 Tax=Trichuris suis TaxID=68888 RepID=A0A085MHT2_9BILA|nr:hypothetical protein M513_02455 [Trichuris suis]KFD68119.1 hypothetical protein M514_02455 [Trichuris suis]